MPTTIIGNKKYRYEVSIRVEASDPDAVHIVQPCHNSAELTDLSVGCIRKYTGIPYVLWLVDNCSDRETRDFLVGLEGVNVIFNRTKIGSFLRPWYRISYGGSLANAVALELAARIIDGKYVFVMHNDCVPCREGWLAYLKSRLNDEVKIAGVRQDPGRVRAMHQSGFLFDFTLYGKLSLTFMHNMPTYDVGDQITAGLLDGGYRYFVCKNTYNNPETAAWLDRETCPDFMREYVFDKCFDDTREPIYLHLGRGTMANREDSLKEKRLSREEWVDLVTRHYL